MVICPVFDVRYTVLETWEDTIKEQTGLEFDQLPEGYGEQEKDGESWLQSRRWSPNDIDGLRKSEKEDTVLNA